MPITSTCPHCQKSVRFTEQNAGLQLRCPYCHQTFRADPLPPPDVAPGLPNLEIPAESQGLRTGAVPISTENAPLPFMDFRAVIPPEPTEGEGERERELPYPAPDEPDRTPAAKAVAVDERWWHVSQGLLLVLGAQVVFIMANMVLASLSFLERDKAQTVARVGLLAILSCGLCVHVWGLLTCLRVPRPAGVRGLMHGAAWPCAGGVVLALLAGLLFLLAYLAGNQAGTFRRDPIFELAIGFGVLLLFPAVLAFAVGNVLFLIALRGMAVFFQKPRLAHHLLIFLIAVPIVLLLFGVGSLVLAVLLRTAFRNSEVFSIVWDLLWNGVRLTIHLALLLWGFQLIHQLRWTMDRAVESGQAETAS